MRRPASLTVPWNTGGQKERERERTFAFPSEAHDFAHRKASRRVLVVVPLSIAAAGRERLCHKRGRLGERGAGIYRPLFPQPSMQCMFFSSGLLIFRSISRPSRVVRERTTRKASVQFSPRIFYNSISHDNMGEEGLGSSSPFSALHDISLLNLSFFLQTGRKWQTF